MDEQGKPERNREGDDVVGEREEKRRKREHDDDGEREEKTSVLHEDEDEEQEEKNGLGKKEAPSQVTPPSSPSYSDSDSVGDDVDPQVWKNYYQQISESEGFDIIDFPGLSMMTRIVPITDIHQCSSTRENLVELAKLAITNYNTQRKEAYEFIDLEKANAEVIEGITYYITFRVKNLKAAAGNGNGNGNGNVDGDDTPLETFQAEVLQGIKETQVELCRPKPIKPQN